MPAKSQAQQKFMAGCAHNPSAMKGKCPSPKVAKEFANAPAKDLPRHAKKK